MSKNLGSNRRLAKQLLTWFATAARDLPWRKSRDLYHIWISEIMLQQTQVATVIDYYQRFLTAFPTVQTLAAAEEEQVFRLWEGLGYYRRARQIHAASKQIVGKHNGKFPRTFKEVHALPGIGRYTAGAILSIGLDLRLPILEANTVRLLSRLAGFRGDPLRSVGQKFLWEMAEQILPRKNSGLFNQALMELGSLICTPRSPKCAECPLANLCVAKKKGLQEEIPLPKKRVVFESVTEAAVAIRAGDEVQLRRQQPGERWAGLWDFVRFDILAEKAEQIKSEAAKKAGEITGLCLAPLTHLETLKHSVTRFRITLHCYVTVVVAASRSKTQTVDTETAWVAIDDLETYPLSVTGRQLARWLIPNPQPKKTSRRPPADQKPAENVRPQESSRSQAK